MEEENKLKTMIYMSLFVFLSALSGFGFYFMLFKLEFGVFPSLFLGLWLSAATSALIFELYKGHQQCIKEY